MNEHLYSTKTAYITEKVPNYLGYGRANNHI